MGNRVNQFQVNGGQFWPSRSQLSLLGLGAALLVFVFNCYSIIDPGNVGVVFHITTGSLRTAPQGWVWRIPFLTKVQSYPVSLRTYSMVKRIGEGSSREDDSMDLPTQEGQHIRQDISITYNTSEEHAALVFKAFRGAEVGEIESTFIRRTLITVAQNAAGQFSLTDIISSRRSELQAVIQENLAVEMLKMGFILDKVNLGASHLPATIEQQMQQKMAAQQQAQQADFELKKQQTLAKATVATAEGEAEAILVRAKAEAEANRLLQSTLNQNIIQNKAIDKWNGVLPTVTSGATPLLDLRASGGKNATTGN